MAEVTNNTPQPEAPKTQESSVEATTPSTEQNETEVSREAAEAALVAATLEKQEEDGTPAEDILDEHATTEGLPKIVKWIDNLNPNAKELLLLAMTFKHPLLVVGFFAYNRWNERSENSKTKLAQAAAVREVEENSNEGPVDTIPTPEGVNGLVNATPLRQPEQRQAT